MCLLTLILLSSAVFAVVNTEYKSATTPSIQVSISQQDPDPVAPGETAKVIFKLENQGAVANDVQFEVLPE